MGLRSISLRALVVVAMATTGLVLPVPNGTGRVSALSAVTITQTMAPQTLIGSTTSVTAHIGNTGDTTAFNLMLVLRLPLGVHLATSELPPSNTIVETDGVGNPTGTVVSFENIVDIIPGGSYNFSYTLSHDVGTDPDTQWAVFDTIDTSMEAYASDDEATAPDTEPVTSGSETTAASTDFANTAASDASTELVPILLTKSEPSPEGELLRGVHDHQTVFTITAETGAAAGVEVGLVDDYIPAGLEFLGCGEDDNSATEEYPGSGPINPGNAPPLPAGTCRTPTLVETVQDPPGLPGGVYTHVQWDISQTLPINAQVSMTYVAAIPMFENTTTWPDGAPDPTSLEQGSNLDNNTGLLTTQDGEGKGYTNHVSAGTTFPGASGDVTADTSVEAVDLAVHKYVDRQQINQGEISTWTLELLTSEYVVAGGVSGLALSDVTPDGSCPIQSDNTACSSTTQPGPEPDYTDTTFPATGPNGGPGATQLDWQFGAATGGPNEQFFVTFSTLALTTYSDGTPIVTNDQWTNHVDMTADVTTFEEEGPDGTHPPSRDVTDDSQASQAGSDVALEKEVARPPDGQTCGNGVGLDWKPESVSATGPGDRVCFRLTATPPDFLDTIDATLSDFLPVGFDYEDGSAAPGPANDVPISIVSAPTVFGDPDSGERIDWVLEPSAFIEPANVAQLVFGAILVGGASASMPDIADSGDALTNEARYSYQNTSGEIFVDADTADVVYTEALLDLTKGITQVDATVYDPAIDTATDVEGGQAVTYEIVVTNSGTSVATGVEVLDTLPINNDGIIEDDAICPDQITAISPAGNCAGNDIIWTGLTVPADSSITLNYTWTLPDGAAASTSWTNEAGVVEYHSTTNTGTDFEYVPRDNIDPSREPDANTDPADDDAHVFSPGISVTKVRTTSVTETGNATADQATIGEVITYTIEYRQSQNTTVTDPVLTDTVPATLDLLEPVDVETYQTPPGDPCGTGTPAAPLTPVVTGNVITIARPGDVTAPPGLDACSVITFDAVVLDLNGPVRSNVVTNTAEVTFTVGAGERTSTASVATTIVEPNLAIDKRSGASGAVLPGAQIPYELVVTNVSAAQVSPAHDLVVVDTLPAEVESVADIVPAGGVYSPGAGTITWTLGPSFDLDPGESLTLSYTATLESPLVATTTMTNTAEVTGTSLTGAIVGERTANSACSPGGCPGYEATDSVTLTVAGPTIAKSVASPNQTFGHTVDYELTVVFPANLDFGPTTLTDDLAGGDLKFLSTVNAVCTGCTDQDRTQYDPPPDGLSATPPVWDFGDLGPISTTRRGIITYRAVVVDDPTLDTTDTIRNVATLEWENGSLTDDAVINLAEPNLTLVKSVSSTTESTPRTDTTDSDAIRALPGDTLTYQLVITNDGDWTAYDTIVTDEPDGVPPVPTCTGESRLVSPTVATDPLWEVTDDDFDTDECLGWSIPSILPGQTITLTYSAVVPPDFDELIIGSEFVNVAEVSEYWALTEAERTISPTDVREYPATPLTDAGYVNINGGVLGDFVWFDVNADGVQDPGEPGIPGVDLIVTWFGPDNAPGGGDDVVYDSATYPSLTTDENGLWTTDDGNLPPNWLPIGNYSVAVDAATLPPGLDTNTYSPSDAANFALAENEELDDRDFGYTGSQSLGDFVWLDLDDDGIGPDSGTPDDEPGISGVSLDITWEGFDGEIDTADDVLLATVTTDADGRYQYDAVPAGSVRVTVDTTDLDAVGLAETFDLDGGLDDTAVRVVVAGVDALDVDFGYSGTAALGDRVWLDLDTDGVQDAGEPGIVGAALTIVWGGLPGGSPVPLPIVTSVANGAYSVPNLPAGGYTVTVDPASLPRGVAATYDLDGGTTSPNGATARALAIGESATDVDFGFAGTGSLGDRVWFDMDGDGVQDAGEPGIEGVELTATGAGNTYPTATTGADGIYTVTDLVDATYTVTVDPATIPVGLVPSYDLDGIGTPHVAGRVVDATTPNPTDVDFGYTGAGSIGDTVWYDRDGDGTQDAGEPGIPNIDVTIVWAGFDGDLATTGDNSTVVVVTDADGIYGLTGIPGGVYEVTVETDDTDFPGGMEPTFDLDGIATADIALRVLSPGDLTPDDVDFGYDGTGSIGDTVWYDIDRDGVQGAGEPGIPGVDVTVVWAGFDGALDTADDVTFPTTTALDGTYSVGDLPFGDYRVTLDDADIPDGLEPTFDLDGIGTPHEAEVELTTLEPDRDDVDFGYSGTSALGDTVWLDLDGDGTHDAGEPGIEGVTVGLVWSGWNGIFGDTDDVTYTADLTDASGIYEFLNLPAGDFRVTVDEATLPVELTETFELDGTLDANTSVTLAALETNTDVDFGYTGTASVGDTVWLDRNLNTTRQPAFEPGIPGVLITATWGGFDGVIGGSDDLVWGTDTTDAQGLYLFEHLPPGQVRIDVADTAIINAGLARTFDPDLTLDGWTVRTLTVGQVDLSADFAYNGANTIGDLVWYDVDADGNGPDTSIIDDEPGIPNQQVLVRWAGPGPNPTFGDADDLIFLPATTDDDGRWSVDGLPNGLVRVALAGAPATDLLVTDDRDGNNDLVTEFSITGDDTEFDFGLTGTGALGDRVWLDMDGDATQDGDGTQVGDEPGIGGVTVGLVWAGWDGIFGGAADDDVTYTADVTDASGIYGFINLPAGDFRVTVDEATLPIELTETFELDGTLDANTSITLAVEQTNSLVDFGYAGIATVGDTVWLDRIDDDIRQPLIEPGIPGVVITATWGGFDGVIGGSDDLVWGTDTTDAQGLYLFEHLPPGEVRIDVADTAIINAGLVRTFDPDGTPDGWTVRTLTVGQQDLMADFGYNGANTIGDLVWYDIDADGRGPDSLLPDAAEPGIPNQQVIVRWAGPGPNPTFGDGDDLIFLPVTTDSDGRWQVDGLPNGLVRVTVVGAPATDLRVTHDRDGNNDLTTEFSITGTDTDFDFGLTGTATIGDRVWLDIDRDGDQDVLEPGISGVQLRVEWAGWNGVFELLPLPGNDDVVYPIQTTSLTGIYEVGNLPAGRYRVTADADTLPDGVFPTFDLDGIQTAHVGERTLALGARGDNVDFGYAGTAALGDFVWWDLDGDMIQDVAEPGIPGVVVTATWSGVDGDLGTVDDKVLPPVVTGANGRYEFVNLPAGDFRVSVAQATLPAGMSATFDLDGGGDSTADRAIVTGDTADNVDFGFVGTLTVGDLVWDDVNLDSVRTAGEPAIAGAEVTLQYLGRDGAQGGGDDVFFTAITANPAQLIPSGRLTEAAPPNPGDPFYEIPGLVSGNFVATLDPTSLPDGVTPVSDLDGGDPVTTSGALSATNLDVDFVVFQNVAPLPPVPGTATQVACGAAVVVDPTAGVTDANGDDLSLVPGSVVAPAGVTVEVLANGDLRITTAPNVVDGVQVRWTVQDEHGATAAVTLTLDVNCITATANVVCSTSGAASLSYAVTGTGQPATPPVTITWYSSAGAQLFVASNQPLTGTIAWPAPVPRDAVTVAFTTADGATSARITPTGTCQPIPATGTNAIGLSTWAAMAVGLGVLLAGVSRRRRV